MTSRNSELAELVRLFEEYQRHRHDLAGVNHLEDALASATEILRDEAKSHMHEQVRRLVAMWFERACNRMVGALQRKPTDYDYVRIHDESVQLFNEPLFNLPQGRFDDNGYLRAARLLVFKPERARTAAEQRYIEDCLKRLVAESNAKRGKVQ